MTPKTKAARVLVTGGAGLIGSHLTDQLLAANVAEVVILDNISRGRLVESGRRRAVRQGQADRGRHPRPGASERLQGVDVLFHLAAIRLTQCAEDPRLALDVMAVGTFNVFEGRSCEIPRVVAASSASIYGLAEHFRPTSTITLRTTRSTGRPRRSARASSHRLARCTGSNMSLRPFNVYGPRMDIKGAYTEVLVRWMERIAGGEPPIVFGDGAQTMDFVYVEDVARAFVLAATSDAPGKVFNVASGTETTLRQLAEMLLEVMGSNLPIEYQAVAETLSRLAPARRYATCARAARLLRRASVSPRGWAGLVAWWRDAGGLLRDLLPVAGDDFARHRDGASRARMAFDRAARSNPDFRGARRAPRLPSRKAFSGALTRLDDYHQFVEDRERHHF